MSNKVQNIDIELRAIRSICNGSLDVRNTLLSKLNPSHFGYQDTKNIFKRINGLLSQGKEVPGTYVLKNDPVLEESAQNLIIGGDINDIAKSEADAIHVFEILEKFRKKRLLLLASKEITEGLIDSEDKDKKEEELADKLESILFKMRSNSDDNKIWHAGQSNNSDSIVEKILSPEPSKKVLTGIKQFDSRTGGLSLGQLLIVAANTGGGKSAFAIQLASNIYFDQHISTCVISLEMDEEEVYERLLSHRTRIPHDLINLHKVSSTQKGKIYKTWNDFKKIGEDYNCRFSVWCPSGEITINQMTSTIKPYGYQVVILDYAGLIEQDNRKEEMWSALGRIARICKLTARNNNCVFILLAQLSEDGNKLRYSRAMQEHADRVWTWKMDEKAEETGMIEIVQTKARNSRRFPMNMVANFDVMSFDEIENNENTGPTYTKNGQEISEEEYKRASPRMDDLDNDEFIRNIWSNDEGDL